jgi:dihydrofolate reductase
MSAETEIAIIAAIGYDRELGKDNTLLWHMPADLKYFKKMTMGCPMIMGRKTYNSIGRPLPGRRTLVVTRIIPMKQRWKPAKIFRVCLWQEAQKFTDWPCLWPM